ncbi:hypothetical protein MTO96_013997 [Rhipicephalus appendiculatus]
MDYRVRLFVMARLRVHVVKCRSRLRPQNLRANSTGYVARMGGTQVHSMWYTSTSSAGAVQFGHGGVALDELLSLLREGYTTARIPLVEACSTFVRYQERERANFEV